MDPDDERHGTYPGAKAHRRAKEPLCEPCKEAERVQRRNRRAGGTWAETRCAVCGRTTHGKQCHSCESAGAVRPVDLDIDIDPPNWVRRGLIWVAA